MTDRRRGGLGGPNTLPQRVVGPGKHRKDESVRVIEGFHFKQLSGP